MHNVKMSHKNKLLFLFHINAFSNRNFDENKN